MRVSIHSPDGSFISYPVPDDVNLASGTSSTYIGDDYMSREDIIDHNQAAAMLAAANDRISELIQENNNLKKDRNYWRQRCWDLERTATERDEN